MKFASLFMGFIGLLFFGLLNNLEAQDVEIKSLDLEGKIAYVGNDYNIYTVDFATGETHQLTEDGRGRARYEFPTWSVDGQLAFFCCSVRGFTSLRLAIYVSKNGITKADEYYNQDGQRHVYAYWSPTACKTENCVDLAVLIQDSSQSQLFVELFNSHDKENGQRSLGQGTPFYYSWSPSGETLLLHRNNNVLQYYTVTSSDIVTAFEEPLGDFLSPGWSPIDNRIAFVTSVNDTSNLTLLDDDNQLILADNLQGITSFSWAPNGRYIAYRIVSSNSVSNVYVVDTATGELVARSNVSGVLAFFWSPDSSKIAYVTLSNPPGTFDINNDTVGNTTYLNQVIDGLAWNTLNINDSSNLLLNSFIPTLNMQYLLTNFDQFAQSHSIWSPDSNLIVYSERASIDSGDSLITILNVSDPNAVPLSIVEGSFAVWSFR